MTCVRILISEDIPAKNKGEAALFYGLVESLDCIEDKEISLLTTDPEDDQKYYGQLATVVDARGIIPAHIVSSQASGLQKLMNYINFFLKQLLFVALYKIVGKASLKIFRRPIWKAYIDTDVAIMGHDSFWSPLYHSTMMFVMSALNKPCFIYAGSLTPSNPDRSKLYRKIAEFISRKTLQKAKLITLRERISERMLRDIGLSEKEAKIEIYPDLAFLVPPSNDERVSELLSAEGISPEDKLVGMAFNRRTIRRAYPLLGDDDARITQAIKDISSLAQFITDKYQAKILFIPHSIGPTTNLDDRIIARRIIEGMDNPENAVSLEKDYWSHELKGIASKLTLAVGSRLHFCIDALSTEVPALFVTYKKDIRGHGIIGDMMDRKDYLYDIDDMKNADDLISTVDAIWNRREEITKDLNEQLPGLRRDTKNHGRRLHEEFLNK